MANIAHRDLVIFNLTDILAKRVAHDDEFMAIGNVLVFLQDIPSCVAKFVGLFVFGEASGC